MMRAKRQLQFEKESGMKRTTVVSLALLLALAIPAASYAAAEKKAAATEKKAAAAAEKKAAAPAPAAATAATGTADSDLNTTAARYGYAIGVDIGRSLTSNPVTVDLRAVTRGLRDMVEKRRMAMTDDQMKAVMDQFRAEMNKEMMALQQKSMKEMEQKQADWKKDAPNNLKVAQEFLAKNKAQKGVQTLPSGLQYTVEKEGTGPSPTATDLVSVHYRGTLMNGEEFDSSYKRGQPAEFQVGGVIPGWTEALQKMKVGGKWKLVIPPNLAYGEEGRFPRIPPNALLIFEVELLDIVGSGEQPGAMPGALPGQPGQPGARPTPAPQPKVRVK
jgi:FKBP-type peptidyl-prolyl cis-trans isomerase